MNMKDIDNITITATETTNKIIFIIEGYYICFNKKQNDYKLYYASPSKVNMSFEEILISYFLYEDLFKVLSSTKRYTSELNRRLLKHQIMDKLKKK